MLFFFIFFILKTIQNFCFISVSITVPPPRAYERVALIGGFLSCHLQYSPRQPVLDSLLLPGYPDIHRVVGCPPIITHPGCLATSNMNIVCWLKPVAGGESLVSLPYLKKELICMGSRVSGEEGHWDHLQEKSRKLSSCANKIFNTPKSGGFKKVHLKKGWS